MMKSIRHMRWARRRGLGRSSARPRAGLSHQAHHHRLGAGLRRRQRHRHPRDPGAAAGRARPAHRDGEPAGRQRQCRRRRGRPLGAGRLHPDGRHRRHDDVERASVQKHAVRSGEGLRADHQWRRQHHRPGGARRRAGKVGGRACRLRQGQSGQGAVRHVGRSPRRTISPASS